jgi:hypothetical protein
MEAEDSAIRVGLLRIDRESLPLPGKFLIRHGSFMPTQSRGHGTRRDVSFEFNNFQVENIRQRQSEDSPLSAKAESHLSEEPALDNCARSGAM